MGSSLLFQPREDQERLQKSLADIPTYLFRLYAPRSAGKTNADAAVSQAAANPAFPGCEPDMDLLQLSRSKAADMLWHHLKWKNKETDNLVSWTSSLLFALQHGLRRSVEDFDRPSLSDIWLCIVDTRDFRRGTFIKDMDVMEAYSGFPNVNHHLSLRKKEEKGYYYGEYLSQGRLGIAGRSRHVSLRTLVDLGLYSIEPRFEHGHHDLCRRIEVFRNDFKAVKDTHAVANPLTKAQVRKAIATAQASFGDEFVLPFAAMLLSFRPRKKKDPVILDAFAATFTDEEISALSRPDLTIHGERLPEVNQFGQIIYDIKRTLGSGSERPRLAIKEAQVSAHVLATTPARVEEVLSNLTLS